MSFGANVIKFNKRAVKTTNAIMKKGTFDLSSAVIKLTPVDTGVARNNWFVEVGRPSTEVTKSGDASGSARLSDALTTVGNWGVNQSM